MSVVTYKNFELDACKLTLCTFNEDLSYNNDDIDFSYYYTGVAETVLSFINNIKDAYDKDPTVEVEQYFEMIAAINEYVKTPPDVFNDGVVKRESTSKEKSHWENVVGNRINTITLEVKDIMGVDLSLFESSARLNPIVLSGTCNATDGRSSPSYADRELARMAQIARVVGTKPRRGGGADL